MLRMVKFLAVVTFLLMPGPVYGQERPWLGVMDISPLSPEDAELVAASRVVSQLVRHELAATGAFEIVERERMQDILREHGLVLTGCTTDSCAIEVGQLLNAQKMAVGTLGRLGSRYVVTLRVIDVELGIWESQAVEEGKYELEQIGKLVKPVVRKLVYEGGIPELRELAAPLKEGLRVVISLYYSPAPLSANKIAGVSWDEQRRSASICATLRKYGRQSRLWWEMGLAGFYDYAEPGAFEVFPGIPEASDGELRSVGTFLVAGVGGPADSPLQVGFKLGVGRIQSKLQYFRSVAGSELSAEATPAGVGFLVAGTLSLQINTWFSLSASVETHREKEEFGLADFEGLYTTFFSSLQTGITITL